MGGWGFLANRLNKEPLQSPSRQTTLEIKHPQIVIRDAMHPLPSLLLAVAAEYVESLRSWRGRYSLTHSVERNETMKNRRAGRKR